MATFKIMKNASTFSAVKYNEEKQRNSKGERSELLNFSWLQNKENLTQNDIKAYLEKWSSFNTRIKHKQFHAVISGKGRSESFEQLQKKALSIMQNLGYGNNPILFYAHKDTENNHVHIVSTRVDQNGKKIDDSFERIRAMSALQAIEKIEPKQQFDKDVKEALEYNFSTTNQLNLLMEQKGYTPKPSADGVEYWKFDAIQGNIEQSKIDKKICSVDKAKTKIRAKQLTAIISKYKAHQNPFLENKKPLYSDGKNKFQSELTNYLKEKFGLEFVFFSKNSATTPYGYMIVDHNSKTVFKGSEVMKLDQLINTTNAKNTVRNSSEKILENSIERTNNFKQNENVSDENIINALNQIIEQSANDNDQGGRLKSTKDELPVKRKKKLRNQR